LKLFLRYGLLGILLVVVLISCDLQSKKRIPSLRESYRETDKLPFGGFVAYKGLQAEFPDYWINIADKPFDKTWPVIKKNSSKYALYFLVTKNLLLSVEEVNAMIEYVKAGNDLFISADYIDSKLLEAVYCTLDRKSEIVNEINGNMYDTHVSMYYGNDIKTSNYGYYYFPFLNYFSSYDTAYARVLGVNENNLPNYLVMFAGKGRLYLHVAPRIFSNYFLLTDDNYHFFENVTAYLRFDPQYVYWDEYYKNHSSSHGKSNLDNDDPDDNFSSLNVVKQNPPLLWAFYIALTGILLYVLFNAKRKRSAIEIIKPNPNATLAFTETVGRLYFQQKNNKNITEKMITYFYEYLRKKYFINTSIINDEFINSLSGKSGISHDETKGLFQIIKNIQSQENVTDQELLTLNEKIDNFKKIKTDGRKFV
jgi:ribosomal protein L33